MQTECVSVSVFEESSMPATVSTEVASIGGESQTVSSQSQPSQASIPEEEISIWIEFVQDVAFGTKTLKLDSGEKIIIPAVTRTVIPSRIISQYLEHCKVQEFKPASDRSLYRMIGVCSASMQKSLHGLVNTTAEGAEAFAQALSMLDGLADQEIDVTATQKRLKDGKRYLKNDSKAHIGRGEQRSDHCTVHTLSDDNAWEFKGECDHQQSYSLRYTLARILDVS